MTAQVAPILGVLAHALHYTLVVGGAIVVVLLLVSARPGRGSRAVTAHEHRVEELRTAAAAGQLATVGGTVGAVRTSARVAAAPPHQRRAQAAPAAAEGTTATALLIAMVSSAAAAGVHAAAGPVHLREGLLIGSFFVVSALAQLAWSMLLLLRGADRMLLWAGLIGNAAIVILWTLTRTVGLPWGLAEVEAVGTWDVAATVWEVAVVACCAVALTSAFAHETPGRLDKVRWSALARTWLVGSVLVMVVLTLTGAPA